MTGRTNSSQSAGFWECLCAFGGIELGIIGLSPVLIAPFAYRQAKSLRSPLFLGHVYCALGVGFVTALMTSFTRVSGTCPYAERKEH
jgi:hypothetical protein